MWNYLRSLQNKPLHTRKMILYVSTVTLFILIVFFWILLLNIQKAKEIKTSAGEILSPFEGIKEIFTKMFEDISTTNTPAIFNEMSNTGVTDQPNTNIETSFDGMNMGTENGTTTVEDAIGTPLQ